MLSTEFFGTFKLIREIGHGGTGKVYLAEDPSRGGRQVALKILPEHISRNKQWRERFKRECASLGRLSHEGVPTIYGDGEIDGKRYVTMEYFEGRPLEWVLANGTSSLGVELAEKVLRGVAGVLGHAHGLGIIHRDISSKNIIVTDAGHVKVIDFGISRLVDEMTLAMTGQHFGTPAYMAPEQFETGSPIDARTDIWSLGAVLYETLTGTLPFPSKNIATIVSSILNPRHALKAPLEGGAGPHLKWNLLVLRCLCRDPAGRYSSCDELVADFDSPDPIPRSFVYDPNREYVRGEVFVHEHLGGKMGRVVRRGRLGRSGVMEAEIDGRNLSLSCSADEKSPYPAAGRRRVPAKWMMAWAAALAAGVGSGWIAHPVSNLQAVGPVQTTDESRLPPEVREEPGGEGE
ncbi:MAG: hypothetical protein A3G34_04460 [Candidatus Lindowbacteria bacterium RIFCSPLOWO2_12_FULL_62_27]|nr:MAG: hypothetical protein A3I06_04225 [Candidatus Lindowbacteria bacterium RIFCSPLOWO2_02_FULL_62_12]OGH57415.1 MAG: hypothetical protein A3G34_04460 [Candidatus Lindowbacteria bacterium RIFCSPLOWO2_12_FULL_62_27]